MVCSRERQSFHGNSSFLHSAFNGIIPLCIIKVVVRACYGAYVVTHVFKYLAPKGMLR